MLACRCCRRLRRRRPTGRAQALQVADRWHLWHNLAGHVERVVAGHRGGLKDKDPSPSLAHAGPGPDCSGVGRAGVGNGAGRGRRGTAHLEASALVVRTQQGYAGVQALVEEQLEGCILAG
jgi:hypothetical protein